MEKKKLATDTYYYKDRAKTVGIIFNSWEDSEPAEIIHSWLSADKYGPYIPGEFYKRELPCIINLFKEHNIDLKEFDTIILDGLARLPGSSTEGLGAHLEDKIQELWPDLDFYDRPSIMGIAKTKFGDVENDPGTSVVHRGTAKTPLYVNTTWHLMSSADAAENLKKMHGDNRIPTLLKLLDRATKSDVV